MSTAAKKKSPAPKKKPSAAKPAREERPNKLGLKPGYAAHLGRIKPGVDLTKPTWPVS